MSDYIFSSVEAATTTTTASKSTTTYVSILEEMDLAEPDKAEKYPGNSLKGVMEKKAEKSQAPSMDQQIEAAKYEPTAASSMHPVAPQQIIGLLLVVIAFAYEAAPF